MQNTQRQVRYRGIHANEEGIVLVEGMGNDAFYNEMEEDDTIDNLDEENVYIEEIEETAIENLEWKKKTESCVNNISMNCGIQQIDSVDWYFEFSTEA